jgi:pimeloyl-ACP methyl ester carboxylesterase
MYVKASIAVPAQAFPGESAWKLKRQHYAALYAMPGAIRAGFAQFAAFGQDALDSKVYLAKSKFTMPVLAIGGEAAFGPMMATVMRFAATDVREAIVPDSGHWIMEENPLSDRQTRYRLPQP